MDIRAVIMAGGNGTRLRPLTCDLPKPMVPVLNRPVMSYTIDLLKKHEIRNIAVTLAYMPEKIQDYFGDGSAFGVSLEYFVEDTPLGTAGSVKNTGEFLGDTFIVISGDALTDLDISRAVEFHRQRGSQATLVLHRQAIPLEYGVVITDAQGRITRFLEKPSWGEVFSDTVNTGIYILEPEVMEYCAQGGQFDFSKDLFPLLLRNGIPMYGYITDGYWCDIGDLRSYRQAQFDVLDGKVEADIDAYEQAPGVWVGEGCERTGKVQIAAPAYIGRGCVLEDGCSIGPYTVLNEFCQVGEGASLKRTVVWKRSRLGKGAECRGATICSNVSLDYGVRLFEDSVVGNGSLLEQGATIRPGVKVWPGKTILENTELSYNLVWGSRLGRRLFGRKDINGVFNVEVTPEFASRLGSAFAALAGKPGGYVVSGDNTEASALAADALSIGIIAGGSRVIRGAGLAAPMTRYAVRHYGAAGGIHVRMDAHRKNRVHLEFFAATGANIDRGAERKLEAAFNSDDFQRAGADNVEIIQRSSNMPSLYFAQAAAGLMALGPGKSGPYVVLGGETDHIFFLGDSFLGHIGCKVKRGGYTAASVSARVLEYSTDFGIFLGADGEDIVLVDEDGVIWSDQEYRALTVWIALQERGNSIVIPYDTPQAVREMARHRAEVIPVKSAPGEVMAEMLKRGKTDPRIALQYLLSFDGIQAAARIADFLSYRQLTLNKIIGKLPALHCRNATVPCQWTEKGRVLRELVDWHNSDRMELYEGVKITDDKGWALVLPDSEKAQFNIFAEGYSEEYAEELVDEYSEKVHSLLEEPRGRKQ